MPKFSSYTDLGRDLNDKDRILVLPVDPNTNQPTGNLRSVNKTDIGISGGDSPYNVVSFSSIDTDTDTLSPGEIGFYNGTNQVQSGQISQTNRLFIADHQALFNQDPTSPVTPFVYVNHASLINNLINKGGGCVIQIYRQGQTNISYCQANTITKVTGGWLLTNLSWFGSQSISGTGYAWNLLITRFYPCVLSDSVNIIGVLPQSKGGTGHHSFSGLLGSLPLISDPVSQQNRLVLDNAKTISILHLERHFADSAAKFTGLKFDTTAGSLKANGVGIP